MTSGMIDEWFHDRNGNESSYYYGDYTDPKKEEWRRNYWQAYQKHIASKGVDWQDLKEQRVVLENDGFFVNYRTLEDRKSSMILMNWRELFGAAKLVIN